MRHWLPIVTMLLLLGRDGSLSAQREAPQFEFVSVRRVPALCGAIALNLRCERQTPPTTTLRVFAGNRFEMTNQRAIDLVRVAYGVEQMDPRYVSGGPGWLESERYDVIALTGADGQPGAGRNTSPEQVRLMLRGLLADRFKLRVRVVPKKTDVFVLSRPASGALGPGLKASSGACLEPSADWSLPECARYAKGGLQATDISMGELADVLSRIVRIPVVDETKIAERYDVSVELGLHSRVTGLVTVQPAAMGAILQRELGLDLQRAKRVVNRVEITGAERPVDD